MHECQHRLSPVCDKAHGFGVRGSRRKRVNLHIARSGLRWSSKMKQIRKRGMNFVSVIDRTVKLAPHCLTRTVHRRPGQRSAINDPLVFTQTDIRTCCYRICRTAVVIWQSVQCFTSPVAALFIVSVLIGWWSLQGPFRNAIGEKQ